MRKLPYSAPLSMTEKAEMLEKEIMSHTHLAEVWQLTMALVIDDFAVRCA